jgi:hypothetical protein
MSSILKLTGPLLYIAYSWTSRSRTNAQYVRVWYERKPARSLNEFANEFLKSRIYSRIIVFAYQQRFLIKSEAQSLSVSPESEVISRRQAFWYRAPLAELLPGDTRPCGGKSLGNYSTVTTENLQVRKLLYFSSSE